MMTSNHANWLKFCGFLTIFIFSLAYGQFHDTCEKIADTQLRGSPEECDAKVAASDQPGYPNLPILNGVYCFNNGTGICKAFAGQFEFYFNTFTDQFLYPAPAAPGLVDSYGYHTRIPASYNINGDIIYNDVPINWARSFVNGSNTQRRLLSTKDFNWCGYAPNGYWPYKSAIKDSKSGGRFHIYFYNRQSCIVDSQDTAKKSQHYNTRFLHKSLLRADLDMNPVIFNMEDNLANNDIRLVKHKRQHWYEVKYELLENPTSNIWYFVKMDTDEAPPSKINSTSGPVLTRKAYEKVTDVCLTDKYHMRKDKNSKLLNSLCGTDEVEIADSVQEGDRKTIYEVSIHNIPRYPKEAQSFYGVSVETDKEWEQFAKDGFVFSATTSIPLGDTKSRVIMLYAEYKVNTPDIYDEYYPMPYIADYTAIWTGRDWDISERQTHQKQVKDLNYVNDIAYLHTCKTILIVFGPLYTEMEPDKFDVETKTSIGSIYDLGMWEQPNAFTAIIGENTIYVYYRTNWMAELEYTCGTGGSSLVKARQKSPRYYHRNGETRLPSMPANDRVSKEPYSEEQFFKRMGVFNGTVKPEAPDPANYPFNDPGYEQPSDAGDNTTLYVVIGIGALLIAIMLLICLVTFRRRRKRTGKGFDERTKRSDLSGSGMGTSATRRSSGLSSKSGISGARTERSRLKSQPTKSPKTTRSSSLGASLGSRSKKGAKSRSPTVRSDLKRSSRTKTSPSSGSRS